MEEKPDNNESSMPSDIAALLLAIARYSDATGLGDIHGILKYNFNLADDQIYGVLRENNKSLEGLKDGISKEQSPPSPKERLELIIEQLRNNYESVSFDKALAKFSYEDTSITDGLVAIHLCDPQSESAKMAYNSFMSDDHCNPKFPGFIQMPGKKPDSEVV